MLNSFQGTALLLLLPGVAFILLQYFPPDAGGSSTTVSDVEANIQRLAISTTSQLYSLGNTLINFKTYYPDNQFKGEAFRFGFTLLVHYFVPRSPRISKNSYSLGKHD